MIQRFQIFLGPYRFRLFIVLLGSTGLISLVLNAINAPWVASAQNVLLLVFLVGSVVIIGGRMTRAERWRWGAILAPAVGAILLGVLFLPQLLGLLMGAALGWILVGVFLFRPSRGPIQYRQAIKYMRKGDYEAAVKIMDGLIKTEPNEAAHYRFRAELLRLWGKFGRAKRDYEKLIAMDPSSAVAYNGLAEVQLQAKEYTAARVAALKALELAPNEWVAAYNLGMIEDRLGMAEEAVNSLQRALAQKVPDARHRLLIYLYLLRAYRRLGDTTRAQEMLHMMKKQRQGLDEWQTILASEQANTLRDVLGADIQMAERLIDGEIAIADI